MAHKYTAITFTEQVKQVQREQNSRAGYAQMEQGQDVNFLLSQREAQFISERDSFYMASVSETNWPYVQHRGGPTGFLRIIDEKTIGFADYTGNRQYISTGNFRTNDRVALFLMDYPNQRRLKIVGRIRVIDENDHQTLATLEIADFRARVERGFIIQIEGFDWNCPKYITQRYSKAEVEQVIDPLVQENKALKEQLIALKNNASSDITTQQTSMVINTEIPQQLGDGPLRLTITGIRQLTANVRAFELRAPLGENLPEITAGSHIQVPVIINNNQLAYRHYSICSNPKRRDIYEIAVLNEPNGKGGSKAIHQQYQLGVVINCQAPNNHFQLQNELHQQGAPALLIAGGIGITPIKSMAQSLQCRNVIFTLHYAGQSKQSMAFRDRLSREFGDKLTLYYSNEQQHLNIKAILTNAPPDTVFYFCGPNRLIEECVIEAKKLNISPEKLCFERFNTEINAEAQAVTVKLERSNKTLYVDKDQSILDAMLEADIPALYSCKTGDCKTCAVKVLSGNAQHFDNVLSVPEQHKDKLMCPCVSRATSSHITLDI